MATMKLAFFLAVLATVDQFCRLSSAKSITPPKRRPSKTTTKLPTYQSSYARYYDKTETVSIAFVLPNQNLTSSVVREQLRQYFTTNQPYDASLPPQTNYRLQVNPVYATTASLRETAQSVFCSPASEGANAVFVLVDKVIQGEAGTKLANFVTTLANAAGMPTLVWSTSAFELEADITLNEMPRFLLAPSIRSQARAMFAFLQTHQWQKFIFIESLQTPGHEVFANELHELDEIEYKQSSSMSGQPSFVHEQHYTGLRLTRVITLMPDWRESLRSKLISIRDGDKTRFIVLYCNKEEATEIFNEARTLGMTSTEYSWVGAKPVLGDDDLKGQSLHFVPGTVVVTYDTSFEAQLEALKTAALLWSTAVRKLIQVSGAGKYRLSPDGVCSERLKPNWRLKEDFINFIRKSRLSNIENRSIEVDFEEDGTLELSRILLLTLDSKRNWSKFGDWNGQSGLHLNKAEYMHGRENVDDSNSVLLRVVTLQEPPYVIYQAPNPKTNTCPRTAVPCKLSPLAHLSHTDSGLSNANPLLLEAAIKKLGHNTNDSWVCCVGLCVDLLKRLAADLDFRFEMYEVADRTWGSAYSEGKWNGLIKELMIGEADLAMTSLKINKERNEAIDFSMPYLETGITMLVNVREVGTSATAFLEPFSLETWLVILIGLINTCAFIMFSFEYVNYLLLEKAKRRQGCSFSPFSSLWLAWAMLFKAGVKVEFPKCFGTRFITCIWGMFCVIFASSYMANLAVFMISKEDFLDFTGLDDHRLKNPYAKNPPFRFATISHGATEMFLKQNYRRIYDYIKMNNKSTVEDGVEAVKNGSLDAFIYDAKVLEYKVGRDKECKLKTVGKWYATTGYAIGFPQGSKWIPAFDRKLIDYQHNGYIQQLIDYWLTGDCQRHKKLEQEKSHQLSLKNFASAFVLLLFGIIICCILLIVEYLFSKFFKRKGVDFWDTVLAKMNLPALQQNLDHRPVMTAVSAWKPIKLNDLNDNRLCERCARCAQKLLTDEPRASNKVISRTVHLSSQTLRVSPSGRV